MTDLVSKQCKKDYLKKYAAASSNEIWLAVEYNLSFTRLKDALPYLRAALNDDPKLSAADRKLRDVKVIGKNTKANLARMVHEVAIHDEYFPPLTKVEIMSTSSLGILHRAARQARISTKFIETDSRALQLTIGKSRGWTEAAKVATSTAKKAAKSSKRKGKTVEFDDEEEEDDGNEDGRKTRRKKIDDDLDGDGRIVDDEEDEMEEDGDEDGDDEDDEEVYEAERLLGKRLLAGEVQYKVQWMTGEKSWETEHDLAGALDLIEEYEEQILRRSKGKRHISSGTGGTGGKGSSWSTKSAGRKGGRGKGGGIDRGTSGVADTDDLRKAMVEMAAGITTMIKANGDADDDADKWEKDGKMPGSRPLLRGDERLEAVGFSRFFRERQLKRTKRNSRMASNMRFADEYNKTLDLLLDKEQRILDCELGEENADTEKIAQRFSVKKEVFEEEWMALDDKLELIQDCSDTAEQGKVAEAWQVFQDAENEQRQTGRSKELEKRHKAAQKKLKEKGSYDQSEFIAQQLGVGAAWYGGAKGGGAGAGGYGGAGVGGHGGAYSGGAGGRSAGSWGADGGAAGSKGAGSQGYGMLGGSMGGGGRPLPQDFGKGDKGGKGGKDKDGQRKRTFFKLADEVLGAKCPPVLKNVFIPATMTFYSTSKSLKDPPKMRNYEFQGMCKMCGKSPPDVKGHEAFECLEDCVWNGKQAMGSRQIFQLGLGVVNEFGDYQ